MTREEAKEILTHNWTRVDNPNYSESELDEAFFMAIETLSAEAVPHGRLIDADALMDLLKKRKQFFVDSYGGSFHCMSEKDKARCDEIDACIASIVNAPTVSADPVQGKWIFNPTDAIDLMFAKPKCSKCGFESSDGGNFCPNCGARMKGADDE